MLGERNLRIADEDFFLHSQGPVMLVAFGCQICNDQVSLERLPRLGLIPL